MNRNRKLSLRLFLASIIGLSIINFVTVDLCASEVQTLAGTGDSHATGDGGLATQAGVAEPYGVVIGPDKNLYVCEIRSSVLRKVDLQTKLISTIAGTTKKGYSGDGGPALQAELNEPYEVRFDQAGNIYFVEMKNQIVRKVDAKTGIISTIAGTGKGGFSGDGGPATKATFNAPHSIAIDAKDNLYICDILNHRIRLVDLKTGMITTFAGTGEKKPTPDNSHIHGTPINGPRTIDFDHEGNLILALREGNSIYKVDLKHHKYIHLAGIGGKNGYEGNGSAAIKAKLAGPKGVCVAPNGDIYFADTESHTIRVIRHKTGILESVVGDGVKGDGPDGDPSKCRLNRPHSVCCDAEGNVYIGDSENHKVRVLLVK